MSKDLTDKEWIKFLKIVAGIEAVIILILLNGGLL